MSNYTVLHCHSDLSNGTTNIDSVTKFKDYIKQAKEWGMSAIAFTEHGSVMQWVKKKETCDEYGIKYIHGCEAYLTESLDEKIRDNYHVCLYAKNWEGVKEINKMLSVANNRKDGHYYYVPRITFEELYATSDNIIMTTACTGGVFKSNNRELLKEYLEFLSRNNHRCYLEIQHHNTDEQKRHNKYMLAFSNKYNIPISIATDTHALNDTHIKGRTILQKAKNIHFDNEDGWDLVMRSHDELVEAMLTQGVLTREQIDIAIQNTNVIASQVEDFTLDRSKKYPHMSDNPLQELKSRITKGVKDRGIDKLPNYRTEYLPRIKEELETYVYNDAIDFLLLDTKIKDYARENGIYFGYSRGSVSGSEVAYLLGMTEMDSIKHKLNFQRFMNKERVSLADVDTDWCPSKREQIKNYVFNLENCYCADIVTFNTIALKGAVKDVCRALGYQVSVADEINKQIDQNEDGMRMQYPDIFEYVDIINGTIVSIGSHPAGTVVSPIPLDEHAGLISLATNEHPVTAINMKEIDGLNFVKLDLLGLDSAEIYSETCKLAGIDVLTPDNTPDDENVWKDIRDNTSFIFQWESSSASDYLKHLFSDETVAKIKERNPNFSYIDLLSVGNGAIRPAGASYRNELASGIYNDNGHKALNDFLAPTLGFLVYQEQIMEFLHLFCGFTMGEADTVRRGFAKKTGTEQYIPRIKEGFIKTMLEKYNTSREESEQIVESFLVVIQDASDYLFSLNHAVAYSWIGYVCGYLRYHYPLEFVTCALNNVMNKSTDNADDKTSSIIEYAQKRGIQIKDIQFGYSGAVYTMDKETNTIYKGIKSISYMNEIIGNELLELYKTTEIKDAVDLFRLLAHETSCNSRQTEILIKLGFFKEFGGSKYLLELYDRFKKRYKKTHKEATREARLQEIYEYSKTLSNDNISVGELILSQIEYMGYVSYVDESMQDDIGVVVGLTDKYANRWITLYYPCNGEREMYKINKDLIQENNLGIGSILRIDELEYRFKKKLVDGKWVNSDVQEPHVKLLTLFK